MVSEKKRFIVLFISVFSIFLPFVSSGQCVWVTDDYDNFEYSTAIPGLISGTTYHPNPLSYAARTGSKGFYMNFVNGLANNTLVFSRAYPVCVNSTYRFDTWLKEINGGSSTVTLQVRDDNNVILATVTNTYVNSAGWISWVTPILNPSTSTIYFEIIFVSGVGNNDFGMDDLKLEICAPPVANQQIDICVNDPMFNLYDSLVTPNGQNGIWSGPSPLSNGYLGTFDPSSDTSGVYTYTIADTIPNCPDSIGNFSITVGLGPQVFLGNDTVLCTSETLVLDATSDGATYVWQDNTTNATFTVSQPGTYWVQVTDSCVVTTDTIVIQYAPYPIVNIGDDTVLCVGESLMLDATTANALYNWNTNDTIPQITVSSAGLYWVDVTVNFCTTRDSISVGYDPMPVVNLGPDSVMCQGESVVLQANNPNATYVWQNGSTNPIYFVNSTGTYWVQVSINNCVASDTVNYTFIPLPNPDLGKDTSLCTGQTLSLNASFPGGTYLWQDNSTDSTFLVSSAGKYWVAVTNTCATVVDTINVTYNPYPDIDLGDDFEFCQGTNVRLDAKKTGGSYEWQDQSTKSYFDVTSSGLYSVTVTVKNCSTSDSVTGTMIPTPTPNLGNDTVICSNTSLQLDVSTDNSTYIWQDNSTDSRFIISQPGIYWVEINTSGCIGSDTLIVDEISCEVVLQMPNIITPNGDSQNDIFLPMVIEGVEYLSTKIYNRWGELVYETQDKMVMWPGTKNDNSEVPDGVYYYTIDITGEDGSSSEVSGSVTVLR